MFLRNRVIVLTRMQRNVHTAPATQFTGPHTTAIDNKVSVDSAFVRNNASDLAIDYLYLVNPYAFYTAGTVLTCSFDKSRGDFYRVALAIVFNESATEQITGIDKWKQVTNLLRSHRVDAGDAKRIVHGCYPTQFFPSIIAMGNTQAAYLPEAG